jgi:hypothetical protein
MQKSVIKIRENEKYASLPSHILRKVSIPESFLFFYKSDHYTGKFSPSITSFLNEIENIPLKSLEFHFRRGDFQIWIKNTIGDDELASRIDNIKENVQGDDLRKTILDVLKGRINELRHEMWTVQRRAMKLERIIFSKQGIVFGIDISKIDGEGEFMCPRCKEILSPEDPVGFTYEILDSNLSEDGTLKEASIQCVKCGSIIRLHGFELLSKSKEIE